MLSLVLFALPLRLARVEACSWEEYEPAYVYNYFTPEQYRLEHLQPFHFTYDRLYDYGLLETSFSEGANVDEWADHFGDQTLAKELNQLIYESPEENLRGLLASIDGKHGAPYPFNTFVLNREWKLGKYRAEIEYLLFSKTMEPYVANYDEWTEERAALQTVQPYVDEALAGYQKSGDIFLKQRYAYQAVRLYHRNGLYKDAQGTWEKYMKPLDSKKGLIWWWSLCDYAGALLRLKEYAPSAYNFSLVFDNCPSKRIQSWYGWRIVDEQSWQGIWALCQNNHEKATVQFLKCMSPEIVPAEELEALHALEGNSSYVELVVLREINKLEMARLGNAFERNNPFFEAAGNFNWRNGADTDAQARELQKLVSSMRKQTQQDKREFWLLADSYLSFLNLDFDDAKAKLEAAKPQLGKASLLKAKILSVAYEICSVSQTNPDIENRLLGMVESVRTEIDDTSNTRLTNMLDEGLSLIYRKQGQTGKALLARNSADILFYESTLPEIDNMLDFLRAPKRSRYEELLAARLPDGENSILELRATRLLGDDRFEEAIAILAALPESYREASTTFFLEDDPFIGKMQDYISCENRYCAAGKYTKLSYAKRVQELRKLCITDQANSAKHALELGHAFYNTSYFGPAWQTMDYYRRYNWFEYDWNEPSDDETPDMDEIRDRKSMELAVKHYTWAMENASNKEMAAEACFHLAKAQQNLGYLDNLSWEEQARPSFDLLMSKHKGTKFYNRAVRECKYFYFYTHR
jgi:hypothetical protein